MCWTWCSAVLAEMNSRPPFSRFDRPRVNSPNTSTSRSERPAGAGRGAGAGWSAACSTARTASSRAGHPRAAAVRRPHARGVGPPDGGRRAVVPANTSAAASTQGWSSTQSYGHRRLRGGRVRTRPRSSRSVVAGLGRHPCQTNGSRDLPRYSRPDRDVASCGREFPAGIVRVSADHRPKEAGMHDRKLSTLTMLAGHSPSGSSSAPALFGWRATRAAFRGRHHLRSLFPPGHLAASQQTGDRRHDLRGHPLSVRGCVVSRLGAAQCS